MIALFNLMDASPATWRDKVSNMPEQMRDYMIRELDGFIMKAGRLRGYMDARRRVTDHALSVAESNRVGNEIRSILGYEKSQDWEF